MRKFLLLSTIFVASTALAFGGIGIGGKSSSHKAGVDAIGIHIDPNGKKADIDILDPCPDGLERNTDGSCTVCANGNVYLSYMTKLDDPVGPCDTDTPMNQIPCDTSNDCYDGQGNDTCCDTVTHTCRAALPYSNPDKPWMLLYACPAIDKTACKKNSDCASGEYCHLMNMHEGCDMPDTGTCMDIGEANVDWEDKTVAEWAYPLRISQKKLPWWAADNWCKAQGMNLINISKFECYENESNNLVTAGSEYYGGCCSSGASCSWDGNWYLTGNSTNYSSVLCSLRDQLGNTSVWTASNYGDASCYAFYAALSSGVIVYGNRGFHSLSYALCE